MPPCDYRYAKSPPIFDGVSILVLVDAALRLRRLRARICVLYSFNPCFSGCRPATRLHLRHSLYESAVSILVLVDAALRLDHQTIHYCISLNVSILVLVDAALRPL